MIKIPKITVYFIVYKQELTIIYTADICQYPSVLMTMANVPCCSGCHSALLTFLTSSYVNHCYLLCQFVPHQTLNHLKHLMLEQTFIFPPGKASRANATESSRSALTVSYKCTKLTAQPMFFFPNTPGVLKSISLQKCTGINLELIHLQQLARLVLSFKW